MSNYHRDYDDKSDPSTSSSHNFSSSSNHNDNIDLNITDDNHGSVNGRGNNSGSGSSVGFGNGSSLRNSFPSTSPSNLQSRNTDRISPLPSLITPPPPSEPIPRRSRGYSLRSQLFAKSMIAATKDTLSGGPSNNANPTTVSPIPTPSSVNYEGPAIEMTDNTNNNTHYSNRPPSIEHLAVEDNHLSAAYHRHMNSTTSSNNDASVLIKKSAGGNGAAASSSDLLPHYSSWARTKSRHGIRRLFHNSSGIKMTGIKWATATRDFIIRKKKVPESTGGRGIPIQVRPRNSPLLIDDRTNKPYCDNNITSSIYTPYNFLPRQLIYQFSKLANL